MANIGYRRTLRSPGRLVITPTDLSGTYPYGGTAIGYVRQVTLVKANDVPYSVTAEEFGGDPVALLNTGEAWVLSAFLRGWDPNAVATIFPNTSTGGTSGRTGIAGPGSVRAGHELSGVKLLFAPYNTDDCDAVILYRAVPHLQGQAEMALSRRDELGMPVLFTGMRDSSGRVMAMKPIEDITL